LNLSSTNSPLWASQTRTQIYAWLMDYHIADK
jgi:hypothetical protein